MYKNTLITLFYHDLSISELGTGFHIHVLQVSKHPKLHDLVPYKYKFDPIKRRLKFLNMLF